MSRSGVLFSRLVPPRLGAETVARPRLAEPVVASLQSGRRVVLRAGAGYGKTVLLAQVLSGLEGPTAWCALDGRISTAHSLLEHIASALSAQAPGFGAGLPFDASPEAAVAAFVNEVVMTIPDEVALALDDVHLLPEEPSAALGLLARDLPPNVGLLLASRAEIPFIGARDRLTTVTELTQADLALTTTETAEILESAGLDASRAPELHELTEGWVAATLAAGRAQAGGARRVPATALFGYVSEEVLAALPPDRARFLVRTSVLSRLVAPVASIVGDVADAEPILEDLADSQLFTTRIGDGVYRYHHLFGAFLRDRMDDGAAGAPAEIHLAAARAWEAVGERAEAVDHLLAAGRGDEAIPLIDSIAPGMAATTEGALRLAGWLAALPPESRDADPTLVGVQGMLLLGRYRYDEAFALLERSVDMLLGAGAPAVPAATEAALRLMLAFEATGRFARGVDLGERLAPLRAVVGPMGPVLLVRTAGFHAYLGDLETAERLLRDAIEAEGAHPATRAYADLTRAWTVLRTQGRLLEARDLGTPAVAWINEHPDADVLVIAPWMNLFLGTIHHDLGEYERAMEYFGRMLELSARFATGAVGEELMVRARHVMMAEQGQWVAVEPELRAWEPRFLAARELNWNYRWFFSAAETYAMCGHRVDALRALDVFLETVELGPVADRIRLLPDAARVAWAIDEPERALGMLARVRADAESVGSAWGVSRALICEAELRGPGDGDDALDRALRLSAETGDEHPWAGLDRRRAAPLLARALGSGIGPAGEAARLLSACGGDVVEGAAALLADAPPEARRAVAEAASRPSVEISVLEALLRDRDAAVREVARASWTRRRARPRASIALRTLGPLVVFRDGTPVAPTAFVRQKSRTLLAALAAAGGGAHRELLCEWLWPDHPPDRAAGSLRSTLHDLRRAVEPEVDAGSSRAFIVAESDVIRLQLDPSDEWDADGLERLVRESRTAPLDERIGMLLSAEGLLRGTFLSEWPFEDWAAARRRELDAVGDEVLRSLAEALGAAGRPLEAVPRLRRLLERDPLSEGIHRALMRAHVAGGEVAQALRQYHVCRAGLIREQGVEPGDETRALYAEVLANG